LDFFGGFEAFQWVAAIPNGTIRLRPYSRLKLYETVSRTSSVITQRHPCFGGSEISGQSKDNSIHSGFTKEIDLKIYVF
jgi:hypothetical protein